VNLQPRRIVWSREAARTLADLGRRDPAQVEAIRAHVRAYASAGTGDVRKLTGRNGEYRLRIGSWRVVFALGTDTRTGDPAIFVLRIGNPRDVYRS
jgi:mRNA-degrading endonuclease RelE of RelBE toxin-antitoxin system